MTPRAVATTMIMRRKNNTILAVATTMRQWQHVSILFVQHNNQPTTGAAKAGSGGGGNGNSNGSRDVGNNSGSSSGDITNPNMADIK